MAASFLLSARGGSVAKLLSSSPALASPATVLDCSSPRSASNKVLNLHWPNVAVPTRVHLRGMYIILGIPLERSRVSLALDGLLLFFRPGATPSRLLFKPAGHVVCDKA